MIAKLTISTFLLTIVFILAPLAYASGTLSENIRIKSNILGYDLQYLSLIHI